MGKDLKHAVQPGDWRGQGMEGSVEAFGEPQKKSRHDQIYILTAVWYWMTVMEARRPGKL